MEHSVLEQRIALLDERKRTCILMNHGTIIYESDAFGVKPLRVLRQSGFKKQEGDHLILIDRVIGKGALILAELIGVDEIFTPLTSEFAIQYSHQIDLPLTWKARVPMIENRTRTGMCPIERSVLDTSDPQIGEQNIEAAIAFLMQQPQ